MKCFTREHRGGLKESLKTQKYITEEEFWKKLSIYEYYGIDYRCNQIIWIREEHAKNLNEPTWMGIEL